MMNGGYQQQYTPSSAAEQYYGYHHPHHPPPHHLYQQQQQHMQQQQQHLVTIPGGPSPVGSQDTPSPAGQSDDGEADEIRNNNVLKRPSPDHRMQQQQQQQQHHHLHHGHHPHHGVNPVGRPPYHVSSGGITQHPNPMTSVHVAKKPKVSKRKKKRDPNEPQKPVSAYALFFRDSQANIKAANPNAAFGDVSKIVASMWDNLDPDSKAAYKKRTENAKKDYLKKLAAYRASLVSKGSSDPSLYGPFGYAGYEAMQNGLLVGKPGGYMHGAAAAGYLGHHPGGAPGGGGVAGGQPIPPRPPMQASVYIQQQTQVSESPSPKHSCNKTKRIEFRFIGP